MQFPLIYHYRISNIDNFKHHNSLGKEVGLQRDLLQQLEIWKADPLRLPLILKGARQVGKTWRSINRVQYLYLYPLSFLEFLTASDREDLCEYVLENRSDPFIHNVLLDFTEIYMWLGGMQAVVDTWLRSNDSSRCQFIQDWILAAYRNDFRKYARKNQMDKLKEVFASVPAQIGKVI